MEFIADIYNSEDSELLNFFNKVIEQSIQFMRNFLSDSQKNGDIDSQLNLDYIMFMLQKAIDLCGTQELMSMFSDANTMTRQVTQSFIYGIMPVNTIHN
jgi:hypothetical protein